ncbi:MAG TPA: energy transducer TonB [Candidatus Sulfotelmatobacter sp.]|nr:energy transducer TonB [Candidatus Sulfotelmatobacter sp.]
MTRPLVAPILVLIALTSLAASQVAPEPTRAGDKVMADLLTKRVAPVYPPLARQARIQGTVILKVRISKSGDVVNLQLVSGHPMLAPAAIEAVKQWKYSPYLLNGDPVEVETNVAVNFTISDKPAPASGDAPEGAKASESGGGFSGIISPHLEQAPTSTVPQRIRVSSGVAHGLLVSKVNPQYPEEARQQRIQGVVILQAIIDKEGNVANLQLISGHPILAPAAMEAVKQWKYRPYLLNGTAVVVDTQVQVNFTLTQ